MCKKKTNKEKLNVAEKKIIDEEIREAAHMSVHLEKLAVSDPVHKKLEELI